MGSSASVVPATEAEAIALGYTYEAINAYKVEKKKEERNREKEREDEIIKGMAETQNKLKACIRKISDAQAANQSMQTQIKASQRAIETKLKEYSDAVDKALEGFASNIGSDSALQHQLGLGSGGNGSMDTAEAWHGSRGDKSWPRPKCMARSSAIARPGHNSMDASEYQDTPEVLTAKIEVLAQLLLESKETSIYSGAGLSTSAGINDYASKAPNSMAKAKLNVGKASLAQLKELAPTKAHRVLAALTQRTEAPCIKHWVNQNHDGLPQKAGCRPEVLNDIHGSWFDPRNKVVAMSGSLRKDLVKRLQRSAEKTDFCIALGTSLVGMGADRLATAPAFHPSKVGLCIINLQRTKQDPHSALRIFADIDTVMDRLAQRLGVKPTSDAEVRRASANPSRWLEYMYDGEHYQRDYAQELGLEDTKLETPEDHRNRTRPQKYNCNASTGRTSPQVPPEKQLKTSDEMADKDGPLLFPRTATPADTNGCLGDLD